jgi:hypothetical protein
MAAESVTVESDERGFELHFTVTEEPHVDENGHMVVNIQNVDLDAFYDQVKSRIGAYLRERDEARWTMPRVLPDEASAYLTSDPKHPAYHSTHADIWDARDGK